MTAHFSAGVTMRRIIGLAMIGLIAGCDDNSSNKPAVLPQAPSAPSAQVAPQGDAQAPATPAAPGAGDAQDSPGITWQLPKGWAQRAGSNMRLATLVSDTAVEVSVTGFGGQVGGTLANINRWRGQLELPPITDADVPGNTQKAPTANGEATMVDFTGTGADPQRLVAAIVPGAGKTFFFKMTGPSKRIEEAKPGFLELLKSVKTETAQ
jgi:hypothetical protein